MNIFKKYKEVDGYVVDYESKYKGRGKFQRALAYGSIIEFDVDGLKYRYSDNFYLFEKEEYGKKVKIKYNPQNPRECRRKSNIYTSGSKIEIMVIISTILMGIASILKIFLIHIGEN